MDLTFCANCRVVQSEATIPPEDIFTVYPYSSSTAAGTRAHFEGLADALVKDYSLGPGSVVVEIASNDGVLQRPLRDRGARAIGVEPARNICELAWRDGLETLNAFFTHETVQKLGEESADLVVACNVFAHIPKLGEVLDAVHKLLKPDGVLVIEVEYLLDIMRLCAYGNFYQDHLFYWSIHTLMWVLNRHGFAVFKVERIATQGGSIRVMADKNVRGGRDSFIEMLKQESRYCLHVPETYYRFARDVDRSKGKLTKLLKGLRAEGKTIAGYGAAAKGVSIINFNGIGPETISYIIDDSPLKQNKYTPGTHIPIVGPDKLITAPVEYLLLLAWNFERELMEKTKGLGLKYLVPALVRN
jgi:SAM-dependent methyltransferase